MVMLLLAWLVVHLQLVAAAATVERSLLVHNPFGATVKQVHMVLSSHFDGGCKVSRSATRS